MSLYRAMGRGSWVVERTLLGTHVRKATGIYDYDQAVEFERALLKLAQHGRRDLILAFKRDEITGAELLASVERYGLTFQLTLESSIRLRRASYEWLRTVDLAEKTRRGYRDGCSALVGRLPPLDRMPTDAEERWLARGPELQQLPDLLRRYARRAKPVMFVQVRAAWQSFVVHTVPQGRQSELWAGLAATEGPKRAPRDVGLGLSPDRARQVAESLAEEFGPIDGQMWWSLCCTGMEPKEFWREGGWKAPPGRIEIFGTKTLGKHRFRVRAVPAVVTPVRPGCAIKTFRERLHAVGEKLGIPKLTPYVARRTFAHFLELAKKVDPQLLDSQCDILMGHSPKTDRDKYREHDIAPYLPAIGAALRKVIGEDPIYMRRMA